MRNLMFKQEENTARGEGSPPLVKLTKEDPLYYEQVKALRAKFEYKVDLLKIKTVAITSSIAGEGKTTSCAQLAMNLVKAGRKKVLLIDADMRKSELARGMNIPQLPGLSEFLSGSVVLKDIMRNSFLPGLYVIPAGARLHEPAHLLSGEKFRTFLGEARGHFDVILLDTPPVLPVADTLSLRDQVDGFLFLYRVGFTPHAMLRQAAEEIGQEKIIGVVLNGVAPQSSKYYARYYGKYYQKPVGKEPKE